MAHLSKKLLVLGVDQQTNIRACEELRTLGYTTVVGGVVNKETGGEQPAIAKSVQETSFDACIIGRGVQQNAPLLEAVKGLVLRGKNPSVQIIFPPGPHGIGKQLEAAFWSRPGLVSFMLLKVIIGAPVKVGKGASGDRTVFPIVGGEFETFGPDSFKGKVHSTGGADWIVANTPDNVMNVDVRITLEAEDGAAFFLSYLGKMHANDKFLATLSGGPDQHFGDTFFFTNPRFETSSPAHLWMNGGFFVAQGRLLSTGAAVEYRIFKVDV